jgi:cell division transport system permease protein
MLKFYLYKFLNKGYSLNSLRSHITLILALISILFSIFLFINFSNILKSYKIHLINNYSIVIVSEKPIESIDIPQIEKIEPINIDNYINKLKENFKNIDFSKIQFPHFYAIKLKNFPSPSELNEIEDYLKSLPYIKRVLTYRSTQTKIYNLLKLLKLVSNTFMIIVGALGFLLIVKQLEVWKFEHSERMYIMELFGAPFWFKGAALFKIAFIDSIIAFIATLVLIYYFSNSSTFYEIIKDLGINFEIDFKEITFVLFSISFLISIISSLIVILIERKQ